MVFLWTDGPVLSAGAGNHSSRGVQLAPASCTTTDLEVCSSQLHVLLVHQTHQPPLRELRDLLSQNVPLEPCGDLASGL